MLRFETEIKKFDRQGEKTGWTYIVITPEQSEKLNAGVKTSYRVKGTLDAYLIERTALLPMGDGSFIMPLNAAVRKGIKKQKSAMLLVKLELDHRELQLNNDFMECLREEPTAMKTFEALPKGHQNYFSKWIETAKTDVTRAKRIAQAINALAKGWGYSEMVRAQKKDKEHFGL